MKKLSLLLLLLAANTYLIGGDAKVLEPNITDDQKWEEYEANRLTKKSILGDMKEYYSDFIKSIKHMFLLDILFFKNNKIETDFAQSVLKKFDLDLNQVTLLNKPFPGPAATIFNTILIDHHKMAKLTAEEQAFILGHEAVHLKNKDWLTRLGVSLSVETLIQYLMWKLIPLINSPSPQQKHWVRIASTIYIWFYLEVLLKSPIMSYLSRYQEKRCDIESAKTLQLAAAGASAFEKIRKNWICKQEVPLNPSNLIYKLLELNGIFYSHPPLHERTEYLQELAQEQALANL